MPSVTVTQVTGGKIVMPASNLKIPPSWQVDSKSKAEIFK